MTAWLRARPRSTSAASRSGAYSRRASQAEDLASLAADVRGKPGLPLASIGVSTNPGHTTLTLTPRPAASALSDRDSPTTACLVATYGASIGAPIKPDSDAVLTMCPEPWRTMTG